METTDYIPQVNDIVRRLVKNKKDAEQLWVIQAVRPRKGRSGCIVDLQYEEPGCTRFYRGVGGERIALVKRPGAPEALPAGVR